MYDDEPEIHLDVQAIWEAVAEAEDRAVEDALRVGADYWLEHARKRTGLMSVSVDEVKVLGADGHVTGELRISTEDHGADREYASFQEFGTRYITGMHLLDDMERVMAEAAERSGR